MTDRERAAALADDFERGRLNFAAEAHLYEPPVSDVRRVVVTALRAYAAGPHSLDDGASQSVVRPSIGSAIDKMHGQLHHEKISLVVRAVYDAGYAIVPREPSTFAIARAITTATTHGLITDGGQTYVYVRPTPASMRAALVEYAEKGND